MAGRDGGPASLDGGSMPDAHVLGADRRIEFSWVGLDCGFGLETPLGSSPAISRWEELISLLSEPTVGDLKASDCLRAPAPYIMSSSWPP